MEQDYKAKRRRWSWNSSGKAKKHYLIGKAQLEVPLRKILPMGSSSFPKILQSE